MKENFSKRVKQIIKKSKEEALDDWATDVQRCGGVPRFIPRRLESFAAARARSGAARSRGPPQR